MKLYHGDCLEVMREIEDGSVSAMICDPPYGIDYQSSRTTDKKPKILNDKRPYIWFLYDAYRLLKEGGSCAIFSRWDVQQDFITAIKCAGLTLKNVLVWDREIHGMGDLKGNFVPQHDVILFAVKGRFKLNGARPKTVLRSKRIQGVNLIHPNEKPVDINEQLINALTYEGETVLDCFMGSGSTGVACINTNRHFIGIEKDEHYFITALNRIYSL